MEGISRKKGRARRLLTKEKKKGLFLDQHIFFWGKVVARVFVMQIALLSVGVEALRSPLRQISFLVLH